MRIKDRTGGPIGVHAVSGYLTSFSKLKSIILIKLGLAYKVGGFAVSKPTDGIRQVH